MNSTQLPPGDDHPDDATLVAWLDGELEAATAWSVADRVDADAALRDRVQLLRAARAELAWGLGESDTAPPPAATTARASGSQTPWAPWLLAAAALVIVLVVANGARRGGPDALAAIAENDLLKVELTTPKSAWELFSGVRFKLTGQCKTDLPCHVFADNEDASGSARMIRANEGGAPLAAIAVTATIDDGRDTWSNPVGMLDHRFDRDASDVTIELAQIRRPVAGIGPLLTVRLDENGASEDFGWGLQRNIQPSPNYAAAGFVPLEPGNYRLTLTLRAVAFEADTEPVFAEPLELCIGFAVGGVVGKWSEPVDGMRARLVASRTRRGGRPLAIALQLRNDSDRPRKFNVTGHTKAKIPQPLHFDLVVDGTAWRQRDDLGVITPARSGFLPQPVDTMRAVVVLDDYWRDANGKAPASLRGEHELALRFHFEPVLWNSNDRQIWLGQIDTPPVRIDFGPR